MFPSMVKVMVEAGVGLFFIDFETPQHLRVHGLARLNEDVPIPGLPKRSLWKLPDFYQLPTWYPTDF